MKVNNYLKVCRRNGIDFVFFDDTDEDATQEALRRARAMATNKARVIAFRGETDVFVRLVHGKQVDDIVMVPPRILAIERAKMMME